MKALLAGGGTAGHTSPLLATADALRRLDPSVEVTALGNFATLAVLVARLVSSPYSLWQPAGAAVCLAVVAALGVPSGTYNVCDDEPAADTLQDVWLRVLRAFPGLRDPARLRPWLFGIARRIASRHRRGLGRRLRRLAALGAAPAPVGGSASSSGWTATAWLRTSWTRSGDRRRFGASPRTSSTMRMIRRVVVSMLLSCGFVNPHRVR